MCLLFTMPTPNSLAESSPVSEGKTPGTAGPLLGWPCAAGRGHLFNGCPGVEDQLPGPSRLPARRLGPPHTGLSLGLLRRHGHLLSWTGAERGAATRTGSSMTSPQGAPVRQQHAVGHTGPLALRACHLRRHGHQEGGAPPGRGLQWPLVFQHVPEDQTSPKAENISEGQWRPQRSSSSQTGHLLHILRLSCRLAASSLPTLHRAGDRCGHHQSPGAFWCLVVHVLLWTIPGDKATRTLHLRYRSCGSGALCGSWSHPWQGMEQS